MRAERTCLDPVAPALVLTSKTTWSCPNIGKGRELECASPRAGNGTHQGERAVHILSSRDVFGTVPLGMYRIPRLLRTVHPPSRPSVRRQNTEALHRMPMRDGGRCTIASNIQILGRRHCALVAKTARDAGVLKFMMERGSDAVAGAGSDAEAGAGSGGCCRNTRRLGDRLGKAATHVRAPASYAPRASLCVLQTARSPL